MITILNIEDSNSVKVFNSTLNASFNDVHKIDRNDHLYHKYLLADSFDEINSLHSMSSKSITTKDSVYFGKYCSFPSLLLSRLKNDVNLKRTVKTSTANNIIVDKPTKRTEYKNTIYNGIFIVKNSIWYFKNFNFSAPKYLTNINNFLSSLDLTDAKVYIGLKIDDLSYYNKMIAYYSIKDKIVFTKDFINYIWQFLPELDDTQYESVCALISSTDNEARKSGLDCLQYYNFKKHIIDIIEADRLNYCKTKTTSTSKSDLYIKYICNTSYSALSSRFSYTYNPRKIFSVNSYYNHINEQNPIFSISTNDYKKIAIPILEKDINDDVKYKENYLKAKIVYLDSGESAEIPDDNTYTVKKRIQIQTELRNRYQEFMKLFNIDFLVLEDVS